MSTIAEILEFVRGLIHQGTAGEDEVFAWLDQQAIKFPDSAPAVAAVKGILEPLFAAGNIDEKFEASMVEILALLAKKFGPVSDAPEVGLA